MSQTRYGDPNAPVDFTVIENIQTAGPVCLVYTRNRETGRVKEDIGLQSSYANVILTIQGDGITLCGMKNLYLRKTKVYGINVITAACAINIDIITSGESDLSLTRSIILRYTGESYRT